jgi:hypothetical protein
VLFAAYGIVALFNVGGSADGLAHFYASLPRWFRKFGNDNPKVQRLRGAIALGFGAALLLVDLIRFR